jgi:UDP-N-acetylglucosamine 2-epimerase (non-hydrolysing)
MTTGLGAAIGRLLGVPVAHIEAGLRSGDVRHPFPEELIRRAVTRMARVHYAPGAAAARVVQGRGDVVDTRVNTIVDAIRLVPDGEPPVELPPGPFGVVSLHRFELINDRARLAATLAALGESPVPLLFVDHPVTVAALRRFALDVPTRIPRLSFFGWIQLLRRASFVVSDSGGAQEECYFLDVPCLVHRVRTERADGLGETSVLSGLETDAVSSFLHDHAHHRRQRALPEASPSQLIADDLVRRHLV